MADVQIEHGYTRLANDILENMATIKLSPTQYRILFIVWRYTYGFKRKSHEMSLSFLSEATGVDKRNIQRELKSLEERKVILQEIKSGSYRKISFNKNYDEWVGRTTIGKTTIGEITIGETNNTAIGETNNGTIGETDNQERNKEIPKESSSSSSEVYDFYHKNIQKGISSSPFVYEQIEHWIKDVTPELVLAAMKLAAKKEMRGFDYTEGILKNWTQAGVKTIEDARKYELEFKAKKKPYNKKEIDWEDL